MSVSCESATWSGTVERTVVDLNSVTDDRLVVASLRLRPTPGTNVIVWCGDEQLEWDATVVRQVGPRSWAVNIDWASARPQP